MEQYAEQKKDNSPGEIFLEEDDENIYSSRVRERLVDEDNLQTHEDAFMQGYEESLPPVDEEEEEFLADEDTPPEETV